MRRSPFIRIAESLSPSRCSRRRLPPPSFGSCRRRLSSYPRASWRWRDRFFRHCLFHPRERAGMPPRRGISASIGCLFNLRIRRLVSPQLRKGALRPVRLNFRLESVTRRSMPLLSRFSIPPPAGRQERLTMLYRGLRDYSRSLRDLIVDLGYPETLRRRTQSRRRDARQFRKNPRSRSMYKNEAAKLTSAITRHATLRSESRRLRAGG